MRLLAVLLGLCSALTASTCPEHKPAITSLYTFPNGTLIENLKVLHNGHLILTEHSSSSVYTLDTLHHPPIPKLLITLPNASVLFGITPLANGLYAVVSAHPSTVPHRYLPDTFRIQIINPSAPERKVLVDSIPIPHYEFINGLTTLPSHPDVILAADSFSGSILRIDTTSHSITTAWKSPLLGYGKDDGGLLIGVNGIRIHASHLYFTNSRLGTFSRVLINEDGFPIHGDASVEVLALLPGFEDGAHLWDDFDFDKEGNAWITAHPGNLIKVNKEGKMEVVIREDSGGLTAPTAAAFGKEVKGREVLFVTSMAGQVVKVEV